MYPVVVVGKLVPNRNGVLPVVVFARAVILVVAVAPITSMVSST